MVTSKIWRITMALMAALLVVSSFAGTASAATEAAPVAQELRTQEIKGTIPGGQSAEIWLGLETVTPNERITLISTWDRLDPAGNGLGFYVLTDQQRSEVLSGTNPAQSNLATGSRLSPESPENEVGAEFQATSDAFTLIVYNDSTSDANFTISATNAFITDGSGQVEDAMAMADEEEEMAGDEETEAGEEAAEEEAPTPTAAPEEEEEPAADEAEPVATPEAAAEADEEEAEPTPVAVTTPGVIQAQELEGELPEQGDQHFLGLEPSVRDGRMDLVMAFDPRDNSQLATRIGFWVLGQDAFNRYLNPNEDVVLSQVAVAAGSPGQPGLESNEFSATVNASGFGPYTVVVYNNSNVPATYSLRVDGGALIDDSGQTQTAMMSLDDTETMTGTVAAGEEADATAIEVDDEAAAPGRTGEPGGTYTVVAGDTLSLIARDIYGDVGLWEELCAYNELADCNILEVGDVLELPTTAEIGTITPAPATTAADAEPEEQAAEEETQAPAATPTAAEPVTGTTGVTATTEITATAGVTDTAGAETDEATGGEDATTLADIVTLLEAQGGMTILVDALQAASLDDTLARDPGPFTIFAPTDAAFEATLPNYEDLFANPAGTLTELLLYHVVSESEIASGDITDGMQATTAHQGLPVKFEITDDGVKIQDSIITRADLEASNGIIHIIDKVMIPSDLSQ